MVTHAHWRQFDYLLLIAVTLLIILGVVMIRSATLGVESLAATPIGQTADNAVLRAIRRFIKR